MSNYASSQQPPIATTGGPTVETNELYHVKCTVVNGCVVYTEVNPLYDQTLSLIEKVDC